MRLHIPGSVKAKFAKGDNRELVNNIKNIFGFYPENVFLYKLAFRHKSVAQELHDGIKNSNERLEYLGDAILSSVVADYLFKLFPYKNEGFLTKMRSKMVSRAQLNSLAIKIGINEMVNAVKDRGSQPKSLNGDAFEALIGAIYLDKGYKFTQRIIINKIYKPFIDIDELVQKETNYKSRLIEWSQKEKINIEFKHSIDTGKSSKKLHCIDLYINDKLVAKSKDFSIKGAEQSAAEIACLKIKNNKKD